MLNTQATELAYDDMYEALITAHQGLPTEESHAMNARLVLLLANHISDLGVLQEAFRLARGASFGQAPTPGADRAAITPVAPVHAA